MTDISFPALEGHRDVPFKVYAGYGIIQLQVGEEFVWVTPSELQCILDWYKVLGQTDKNFKWR